MDSIIIGLLVAIAIGITVSVLLILLVIKNASDSSGNISNVNVTCETVPSGITIPPLPKDLTPFPSGPFTITPASLGSGVIGVLYYSDVNASVLISTDFVPVVNTDKITINPPTGTKAIQYSFLCSNFIQLLEDPPGPPPIIPTPPAPIPLVDYINYDFQNNTRNDLNATMSNDTISEIVALNKGSIGTPNPPYGWTLVTPSIKP